MPDRTSQDIRGLEAAYLQIYNRPLGERVAELAASYSEHQYATVCTELNPGNPVPCFWTLPELIKHYKLD